MTSTGFAKPLPAFERSAEFYDAIHASKNYAREFELIKHHLRLTGDMAVADYGCGTGQFTKPISECCRRVTGIDPSKPMLEIARRKITAENSDFDLATITGHRDRIAGRVWYDAACCMFGAMSYATAHGPLELTNNLRAIRDVVVPGSRLVFDVLHYAACLVNLRTSTTTNQIPVPCGTLDRHMRKRMFADNAIVDIEIRYELCSREFPVDFETTEWFEHHSMRAFTVPEIVAASDASGWKCLATFPAPDHEDESGSVRVTANDYYIWAVLQAT